MTKISLAALLAMFATSDATASEQGADPKKENMQAESSDNTKDNKEKLEEKVKVAKEKVNKEKKELEDAKEVVSKEKKELKDAKKELKDAKKELKKSEETKSTEEKK